MKDPPRLREGDDIAAALLSAGRAYKPSRRARRQARAALGIPVSASLLGWAAAYAASSSVAAKTAVLVCVLAAAGGGGGVVYLRIAAPARRASSTQLANATAVVAAAPRSGGGRETLPSAAPGPPAVTSRPIPAISPPAVRISEPSVRRSLRAPVSVPDDAEVHRPAIAFDAVPTPSSTTPSTAQPRPSPDGAPVASYPRPNAASLAPELALLGSARAALVAKQPLRALEYLERHARGFPTSVLADEAEVMRIISLSSAGRQQEATARAQLFVNHRPPGMLRDRVRRMLDMLRATKSRSDDHRKSRD